MRASIVPLVLALVLSLAANAERPDDASVAAKRMRRGVDPGLAAWTDARMQRATRAGDNWPYLVREGAIVVNAASNGDPHALLSELEAIRLRDGAVAGNSVSGLLPFGAIAALESCRHLAVARPAMATTLRDLALRERPREPDRARGSVVSQGVAAMSADLLPGALRGAGARVGVLADSFDCAGDGRALDTASGGLPADVTILDNSNRASCSDEGRAFAQIVHDVAPESALGFRTGFNGQADFAEGIGELALDFRADVIVDDVLYFDEPFFQDGVVARAVDVAHDAGAVYVAAAGNAARRSYDAPFRNSGQTGFYQPLGETRRHDFDPGPGVDVFQELTLPPFGWTILVLQWNEPFASASTASPPVGATSDYDLIVYNTETAPRRASATRTRAERSRSARPLGSRRRACFGVFPRRLEPFSSAGGIPILIDGAGRRLREPEIRSTPDLVAPDGVNTTFYAVPGDIPEDADTFPNLFGTSAAAPHVAGVAALLHGCSGNGVPRGPVRLPCPSLTPDEIARLLAAGTIDIAEPGFDFDSGYGLLDARAVLEEWWNALR